jgi:hypothetical protein
MQISSTDALVFVTLALASGRVAYSLTSDDIFQPLRERIQARDVRLMNKRGEEGPYDGQYFLAGVFSCPFCMSFWTSLLAAIAWVALGTDVVIFSTPLALWAVANTYAVKGL